MYHLKMESLMSLAVVVQSPQLRNSSRVNEIFIKFYRDDVQNQRLYMQLTFVNPILILEMIPEIRCSCEVKEVVIMVYKKYSKIHCLYVRLNFDNEKSGK